MQMLNLKGKEVSALVEQRIKILYIKGLYKSRVSIDNRRVKLDTLYAQAGDLYGLDYIHDIYMVDCFDTCASQALEKIMAYGYFRFGNRLCNRQYFSISWSLQILAWRYIFVRSAAVLLDRLFSRGHYIRLFSLSQVYMAADIYIDYGRHTINH